MKLSVQWTTVLLTAVAWATLSFADTRPSNCKAIPGDQDFPAPSIWRQELPSAKEQSSTGGKKHANYRIDVKSVGEVQLAIKFASKHKIRFSILNSGHDFHGRNDAPSGLVVVVDQLKGIRVATTFTPTTQGAEAVNYTSKHVNVLPEIPSEDAFVTFGVGWNTLELNRRLAASGVFTVGAAHESVSVAGGYGQTGGHSPVSPTYGLAVDNFVEYKIVTADGKLRVANEMSEPDLFFALRGGGGGTWGIVVEATMRAFPTVGMASSTFWINATDPNDHKSVFPAMAWLHTKIPEFADQGLTNYYYIFPNAISITSIISGEKGTIKWLDNEWKPILKHLGTFPGMNKETARYQSFEYDNYFTWFDEVISKRMPTSKGNTAGLEELWNGPGTPKLIEALVNFGKTPGRAPSRQKRDEFAELMRRHGPGMDGDRPTQSRGYQGGDSWFLAREHLTSPDLARILADAMPKMPNGQLRGQGVGGPGIHTRGNGTSVTPAWRRVYSHIIAVGSGEPEVSVLRKLAPDMGGYANEAASTVPGWRRAFWGPHYERLSTIKKKYDPEHLFWVTPGIDADQYVVRDGRVCRNTAQKVDAKQWATDVPPKSDNPNYVDGMAKGIDGSGPPGFLTWWTEKGPVLNPEYLQAVIAKEKGGAGAAAAPK